MTPSGEPGKRLAEFTGMNGCSAHQNDSKPSSSAFRAMKPTSTWYAGSGTELPMFMTAGLRRESTQRLAKGGRDAGGGTVPGRDERPPRHEAVDHSAIVAVVDRAVRAGGRPPAGRAPAAPRVGAPGEHH